MSASQPLLIEGMLNPMKGYSANVLIYVKEQGGSDEQEACKGRSVSRSGL